MPAIPLNDDLNDLVTLLGEDNVRQLVRTFLREYPLLLQQLAAGDRKTQHRIAHNLKSNARVIGARALSARMAAIEDRLNTAGGSDLTPSDIASIQAEFDAAALPLRTFAAGA
jgi:HPt (histidine-containing phosphotransfer) domain-containing protein